MFDTGAASGVLNYSKALKYTVRHDTIGIPLVGNAYLVHIEKFDLASYYQDFGAKSSFVKLKIIDRLGREVTTLVDEKKSAGIYQYVFDGNNLSSGFIIGLRQETLFILRRYFW